MKESTLLRRTLKYELTNKRTAFQPGVCIAVANTAGRIGLSAAAARAGIGVYIRDLLGRETVYVTHWLWKHSSKYRAFCKEYSPNTREHHAAVRDYRVRWVQHMINDLKSKGR